MTEQEARELEVGTEVRQRWSVTRWAVVGWGRPGLRLERLKRDGLIAVTCTVPPGRLGDWEVVE